MTRWCVSTGGCMKHQIKSRYANTVVYECDLPDDTPNAMRAALTKAVAERTNLYGANLGEKGKLIGDRPYLSIGPIWSRKDTLTLWITDQGPRIKTGCFKFGTFDEFRANLERDHAIDSVHRKEYEMALMMCEAHAALWTPEEDV